MAVYDRWHRAPREGGEPCRCGRGRNRLYPSADHLQGDRWQVRWRDPATGKQKARNFAAKEGKDPNRHAEAFDTLIQGRIQARNYTDPDAGNVTFHDYAEQWRKSRTHGDVTARNVESRLRNHAYEGEPDSGRTPKGGVSIGQYPMAVLAQRPTLCAGWIAAMPLAKGSRRGVVGAAVSVFDAAVEDGVIARNPLRSAAVGRPGRASREAQPFTAAEVDAIAAGMDERYRVMPRLAAGTGMRQMELSGLGDGDIHAAGRRPRIRVARQLLTVGGELCFAPVKNRRPHDVPLAQPVADALEEHMRRFPPVPVTLPWHEPGSKLHGTEMTVRLVLTRPDGTPLTRGSSGSAWETGVRRALKGKVPGAGKGRRTRGYNVHRARHTAASAWLRAGVDVVRVASWLGDTVTVVTQTYAHLMPDDEDGERAGREAVGEFFGGSPGARDVQPESAAGAS